MSKSVLSRSCKGFNKLWEEEEKQALRLDPACPKTGEGHGSGH